MGLEFFPDSKDIPQGMEEDPYAFFAGELQRRNHIGITADQDQTLRDSLEGDPCDIEPNFNIHLFLFKHRLEVIRQ